MNFLNFPVILILYFACIHINCVISWTQYFYLKPNHYGTSFPMTKKRYDRIWLKSIPVWVNFRFENKKFNFYFKKMKESRTLFGVLSFIIVLGEVLPFLWLVNLFFDSPSNSECFPFWINLHLFCVSGDTRKPITFSLQDIPQSELLGLFRQRSERFRTLPESPEKLRLIHGGDMLWFPSV